MKIIKSTFLFFLLFQTQIVFSQSDCVVAGDSTLINYTNLIPDEYLASYCGYAPPDTFSFDIDNDGTLAITEKIIKSKKSN